MNKSLFYYLLFFWFISSVFSQEPEWITFNTSNSGLPNNSVGALVIDGAGTIWVASRPELVSFSWSEWTVHHNDSISVALLCIDESRNKWIANNDYLVKYDGTSWTAYDIPITNERYVNVMAIDDSHHIWIGIGKVHYPNEGYGLIKYDGVDWTAYDISNSDLPHNFVNAIVSDGSGNTWFCTQRGLAQYNGVSWTVYTTANSGLPDKAVTALTIDDSGTLWIGTAEGGLAVFDGADWTVYDSSNSDLPYNYVSSLVIDKGGNKWIGMAYRGGLAKFDGADWTVYNVSNSGLPKDYITSLAIDGAGNKWITPFAAGVTVFKEGGVVAVKDKKPSDPGLSLKVSVHKNTPITRISYSVTKTSHVVVKVFDIKGRVLKTLINRNRKAGDHRVDLDCRCLSNGAYFVCLRVGNNAVTKKMVVLK
jgi:ligand-binding sensor domain-containing protein